MRSSARSVTLDARRLERVDVVCGRARATDGGGGGVDVRFAINTPYCGCILHFTVVCDCVTRCVNCLSVHFPGTDWSRDWIKRTASPHAVSRDDELPRAPLNARKTFFSRLFASHLDFELFARRHGDDDDERPAPIDRARDARRDRATSRARQTRPDRHRQGE